VEVRARSADPVAILRDGAVVATVASLPEGGSARIAVDPHACNVVRAHVGEGWSGGVYVNCDFAARGVAAHP
jgi:hypothetical protein